MAEGWLRHLASDRYESLSAGARPAGFVHPLAVEVMAEAGIDIAAHHSKSVRDFLPPEGQPPDTVVSLCGWARRRCPRFPAGVGWIHWPLFDPIVVRGNEDLRRSVFRGVRDELGGLIEESLEMGTFETPPESFAPRRGLVSGLRRLFGKDGV